MNDVISDTGLWIRLTINYNGCVCSIFPTTVFISLFFECKM